MASDRNGRHVERSGVAAAKDTTQPGRSTGVPVPGSVPLCPQKHFPLMAVSEMMSHPAPGSTDPCAPQIREEVVKKRGRENEKERNGRNGRGECPENYGRG